MKQWASRRIKQLWYRWRKYSVSLTRDPTVDCSWVGLMDQFTVPPPSLCRTVKCYKLVKVAKEWRNASFICNQWHLSSRWPVKSILNSPLEIDQTSARVGWRTLSYITLFTGIASAGTSCVWIWWYIVWSEQFWRRPDIQYWHLANECPAPAACAHHRCAQFKPYKCPSLTNFMAREASI